MELKDYVRLLRINWRGVTAIVVACLLAGVGWTLTRSEVYAANASGYVIGPSGGTGATESAVDTVAKSKATAYLEFAKSRAVAERVAKALDLAESPATLVGRIEATQPVGTPLIKVVAKAGEPELAKQLADAWIESLAERIEEIENPKGDRKAGSVMQVVPVETADLPGSPVSPDPVRNTGLALVLGLLLGLAYAVLRGTFDHRLRSKHDVEEKFKVSVVGQIPDAPVLKREQGGRSQLSVDAGADVLGQAPTSEAFRKLRTNLTYMDIDNPPRVLVVSSPLPGDGKSTVSANLVAVIERSGQPVVLLDGDLRRPSVASSLGLAEGVGLTDVLTGKLSVEEALQRVPGHDNLRVLAAGSIPPNPSELLGSQAMKNLIARLSQTAMVVIDAPPLLPVTDGAILAAHTDGVLVVISANKTRDHHLEGALESLDQVDARTLGVIVNRVPSRGRIAGYGNYGGYGMYGSYGSYGAYQPPAPAAETEAETEPQDAAQPKRRASHAKN